MRNFVLLLLAACWLLLPNGLVAQPFYIGADMSYTNEMEDCGVVYTEQGLAKDPYQLFAERGANVVRLRLWHTPSWYDTLNAGRRYSDLADVKRSIARAHAAGMEVLLDFHLSDTWADPSRQLAPAAWAAVLDDTQLLGDSLHQYITQVLDDLADENLWPELIQLGNETNRGILLSPEQNDSGWVMDWERNAALFNRGLAAIRAAEARHNRTTQIGLHLAGPANVEWFLEQFTEWGVQDYNFIGISYYWAWHQPTNIAQAAAVVARLRQVYPEKSVIILETGYIWTNEWNDSAANIITEVHPQYAPASPTAQYNWLVDLTQAVLNSGGSGVLYWEPTWVSSPCRTQWGQGSHQEHATFFDFNNAVLPGGGIAWLGNTYSPTRTNQKPSRTKELNFRLRYLGTGTQLTVLLDEPLPRKGRWQATLLHLDGKHLAQWGTLPTGVSEFSLDIPSLPAGIYFFSLTDGNRIQGKQPLVVMK